MQLLKGGSRHDRDDVAQGGPKPSNYQPPPFLGKLLLLSLFLMLNTHLLLTLPTGIDQYSLFSLDLAGGLDPLVLVASSLTVNSIMSLLAFSIYCFIWRPDTTWIRFFWWPVTTCTRLIGRQKKNRLETKQNPFKQFAVAIGVPVTIGILPSILLVNTLVKPYFVIVGLLMVLGLSITGAVRHPDAKLHPSVVTLWYATAAGGVIVLTALAVIVTLHFQTAEVFPPTSNMLWTWGHKWAPLVSPEDDDVLSSTNVDPGSPTQELRYWPKNHEARQREANLFFGLSSIAYIVTVLGGSLLYSISVSARRIPVQASTPDKAIAQLDDKGDVLIDNQAPMSNEDVDQPGETVALKEEEVLQRRGDAAELSISTRSEVAEDDGYGYLEDLPPREWGEEIMKLAKREAVEGDDEAYLASLGGVERHISKGEYDFLVRHVKLGRKAREFKGGPSLEEKKTELKGPLRYAHLYVNKEKGVVISKKGSSFERDRIFAGHAPFVSLCILARDPDVSFTNRELQKLVMDELGGTPNVYDLADELIHRHTLPVEKPIGSVAIKPGTKVCYLQMLDEKRREPPVKTR